MEYTEHRISVSMSESLKRWLESEAEATGLSQAGYIRMLMAKARQSQHWMRDHLGQDMVKIVEALGNHPEVVGKFMDREE